MRAKNLAFLTALFALSAHQLDSLGVNPSYPDRPKDYKKPSKYNLTPEEYAKMQDMTPKEKKKFLKTKKAEG